MHTRMSVKINLSTVLYIPFPVLMATSSEPSGVSMYPL